MSTVTEKFKNYFLYGKLHLRILSVHHTEILVYHKPFKLSPTLPVYSGLTVSMLSLFLVIGPNEHSLNCLYQDLEVGHLFASLLSLTLTQSNPLSSFTIIPAKYLPNSVLPHLYHHCDQTSQAVTIFLQDDSNSFPIVSLLPSLPLPYRSSFQTQI